MVPVSARAASAADCRSASDWVTSSRRRLSVWSTNTPASGESRKIGICPANPTSPSSLAELVRWYASHREAVVVIQVPTSETTCPQKNSR